MGQHLNVTGLPSPDYLAYNLFVLIIWCVVDMNCHCTVWVIQGRVLCYLKVIIQNVPARLNGGSSKQTSTYCSAQLIYLGHAELIKTLHKKLFSQRRFFIAVAYLLFHYICHQSLIWWPLSIFYPIKFKT